MLNSLRQAIMYGYNNQSNKKTCQRNTSNMESELAFPYNSSHDSGSGGWSRHQLRSTQSTQLNALADDAAEVQRAHLHQAVHTVLLIKFHHLPPPASLAPATVTLSAFYEIGGTKLFSRKIESKFYCLIKVSVFLSKIILYLIINYIPFSQGIFSKLIVMSN